MPVGLLSQQIRKIGRRIGKTASRRRTALLFVQDNLSPGIEHPTPLSRQDLKHIRRRKNRILHDGTSVLPGVHMAILARSE
jgi:hypothetical protein